MLLRIKISTSCIRKREREGCQKNSEENRNEEAKTEGVKHFFSNSTTDFVFQKSDKSKRKLNFAIVKNKE